MPQSRTTRDPAAVDTSERRAEITRAAALLFEKQGYHETGMDDIAKAINLRKATLYYYVSSKAELLGWIHNDVMHHVLSRLEARANRGIEPGAGLRQVIADIFEIMDTKPGYLRVFFEHHREIPEPLRTEILRSRDRYQWLVESLIQQGIREGKFRKVNARLATLSLFGITNWSYQWYDPRGELSYDQMADALLDMYLRGIAAT